MNVVMQTAVNVLAILGAFALGGWLTGALMNWLAGGYFENKRLPGWAAWLSRTLGGALFAFIAYLATFGGGGAGLGGTGGWYGGSYPPNSAADGGKEKEAGQKKDDTKKVEPPAEVPGDALRVEVLGDAPLKKLGGGTFDPERRYLVKGKPLTLAEVRERVGTLRQGKGGLGKVEIVLYLDSPNRDRPQVAELIRYLSDLRPVPKIDFYEPGRRADVD